MGGVVLGREVRMMVIDGGANAKGHDEALGGNGRGADGDNCDVDRHGSKNGDGRALKWKLRSFTFNLTLYVSSLSCIDFGSG